MFESSTRLKQNPHALRKHRADHCTRSRWRWGLRQKYLYGLVLISATLLHLFHGRSCSEAILEWIQCNVLYNSQANTSFVQNGFPTTNLLRSPSGVSQQKSKIVVSSSASSNVSSHSSNESVIRWFQPTRRKINPHCDRLILRAHKMGYVLINQYFKSVQRDERIHPYRLQESMKKSQDYRHVVVTRPVYDAIVSGYLYHKSGRECWLSHLGNRLQTNITRNWEQYLTIRPLDPPARGRSICSYLSEESEVVGLKAYADLALHFWYAGLIPYKERVMQAEAADTNNTIINNNRTQQKTLFICFDDLESADTLPIVHRQAMEFLFPNRPYQDTKFEYDKRKHSVHSTSRDSGLRERLKSLVSDFDHQYFDAIGERATRLFQCERKQ